MLRSPKAVAMSVGLIAALTAATLAQAPKSASPSQTIVITGGITWIEKSDVSSLRPGVIKQMEFQIGDRVEADKPIGYLHDETARLTVERAKVAAASTGAIKKADAQRQAAMATLARFQRLERIGKNYVSPDEMDKAEAEVKVYEAMIQEAQEQQKLAEAELALAEQAVQEHIITAPFTGIIIERMKNPGESINANESVVRLGKIDKLRFFGYLPLESASQVRVGDRVEVHPTISGAELPIEQKRFTGKITAIAAEISTVGRTELQVLAEIENPDIENAGLSLRPGMQADLTIFLSPATVTQNSAAAGNRTTATKAR